MTRSALTNRFHTHLLILCAALLVGCATPRTVAPSEPRYYTAGTVDGVRLLAPPPEPGSAEQAVDLAAVRSVFNSRTPEQEAQALNSARLSMFLFAPAIGDWFVPGKFPKVEALFEAVKEQIGGAVDDSKKHWNRERPYQVDPSLTIGRAERNASYPSGHSTRGTVYSMLFAEIFPEKSEAILRIGRQIGWDRLVIGKHFPTDIYAGRVVGKAIFQAIQSNPEFQKAVREARVEVDAGRAVARQAMEPAKAAAK